MPAKLSFLRLLRFLRFIEMALTRLGVGAS
jgi:hypothetical protein